MPAITAATTRVRPAAVALESRFAVDLDLARPTALDDLVSDRDRLQAAILSLVARMDDEAVGDDELDRLTKDVASLLALAEDLRRVRAKVGARSDGAGRLWRDRLDLA